MASKRLRFGDALLVQGTWDEIEFIISGNARCSSCWSTERTRWTSICNRKSPIALPLLLFMVALMVFEVFDAVISVLIGAVLMIVTGCLRNVDDAYEK